MVNSDALSYIQDSTVTATIGDVLVSSQNSAVIDATSTTKSKSAKAMGAVVSVNTVGWDSSTILFEAIEELLGIDSLLTDLTEPPSSSRAWIDGSIVTAGGDVSVIAANTSQLNATHDR